MAKQQEVVWKQLVQLLKATEGSDFTRDIQIYEEMYPLIVELEKEHLIPQRNCRNLDGLLKWLDTHGINTNDLELRFCDSGCGVFAMKNISKEEELVKIPQNLMITSVPDNEELIKLVQSDLMLQKVPHIVLILRIMQEVANPSSFWRQYLESLPTSFNIPMFYTLEKMNDLKGLSVHHDAIRDVFTTLKTFIHLENLNQKYSWLRNGKFTFSSFRWARAIALTRQVIGTKLEPHQGKK